MESGGGGEGLGERGDGEEDEGSGQGKWGVVGKSVLQGDSGVVSKKHDLVECWAGYITIAIAGMVRR